MPRDGFSPAVKRQARHQVSDKCSNPGCRAPTGAVGDDGMPYSAGDAAHIHAASPGGARYDASMTRAQRSGIENAIWLCTVCARKIDREVNLHPPELLREWQASAIESARLEVGRPQVSPRVSAFGPAELVQKVRQMAVALATTARASWGVPAFVAPLTLTTEDVDRPGVARESSTGDLVTAISAGYSVVLSGTGGLGKTTLLLELVDRCLAQENCQPLFFDAATWARSELGILQFLATTEVATLHGLDVAALVDAVRLDGVTLCINGWNEIPTSEFGTCRQRLEQFVAASTGVRVVMTSRGADGLPHLPDALHIEVHGLSWNGQRAIILAELPERAEELTLLLARNTRLRHAARSPLILRGLLFASRAGPVTDSSEFDLLGAAVSAHETDNLHAAALATLPVENHQSAYLEELAITLMAIRSTTCTISQATQALHVAATALHGERLLSQLPSLAEVLQALAAHHLLHVDDGQVRFVHQRFQEYYAARRVLSLFDAHSEATNALRDLLNVPYNDEVVSLVCGRLRGALSDARRRAFLVGVALNLDLGLACDVVAVTGLSIEDSSTLHAQLINGIQALLAHASSEMRDLGMAMAINSGLEEFATSIWPQIEHPNQQIRLHTYRLGGTTISIRQLGPGGIDRINAWPLDRRVELVHELASNPENFDYVAALALSDEPAIMIAAMKALFWDYPAAEQGLAAWLQAPVEVQLENDLLRHILYDLEEGYADNAVKTHLRNVIAPRLTGSLALQLARALPEASVPAAVEAAINSLANDQGADAGVLEWAQTHAADRLKVLVSTLCVSGRHTPSWVATYLGTSPPEEKAAIFDSLYQRAEQSNSRDHWTTPIGWIANTDQADRTLQAWLESDARPGTVWREEQASKHQAWARLLHSMDGEKLFAAVCRRGPEANYEEGLRLTQLLMQRLEQPPHDVAKWQPTQTQMEELVALFADKDESATIRQDSIRIHLAVMASSVAPVHFLPFVIATVERHLDAWDTFRQFLSAWQGNPIERPSNPSGGNYLMAACMNSGFSALPELLRLSRHAAANEFLPEAIARVVGGEWSKLAPPAVHRPVSGDLREGVRRRQRGLVTRQPDVRWQPLTDQVATALAAALQVELNEQQSLQASGHEFNARQAAYRIGRLTKLLAAVPSTISMSPVFQALSSGLVNNFDAVDTLRGLVSQGVLIEDAPSILMLEGLLDQANALTWHDQWEQRAWAGLAEILICAVPVAHRQRDLAYSMQRWLRFSHRNEIVRELGECRSEHAWTALMWLSDQNVINDGAPQEEFGMAVTGALTSDSFPDFCQKIATGALTVWVRHRFHAEQCAPGIVRLLRDAHGNVGDFAAACASACSSAADALAVAVLAELSDADDLLDNYLITCIDAGRAADHSTYSAVIRRFTAKKSIDGSNGYYEVHPRANNAIRGALYQRAQRNDAIGGACRRLLAEIERQRREAGRPAEELRHPKPEDGQPWTAILTN